jgi:hypothetical protein
MIIISPLSADKYIDLTYDVTCSTFVVVYTVPVWYVRYRRRNKFKLWNIIVQENE